MVVELIKKFLSEQNLLNKKIIVAYSGGFDSTCLLHVLSNLVHTKNIVAIHLNHNWRGEESDREEVLCSDFCKKLGILFISERAQQGIPKTEQAARELRYEFFNKVAKRVGSEIVFSAHNLSDVCETLIYRLVKGTGVKGLCSIPFSRKLENCTVYRPILSVSRGEIEEYCCVNGLKPCFDSSNSDNKYKRNYIRNTVLPLFKEINMHYEKAIASLTHVAQNQEDIVKEYLNIVKKKLKINDKLLTEEFLQLSQPIKERIIYDLFVENELEYNYKRVLDVLLFIEQSAHSKSGKTVSLDEGRFLFCSSLYIYIISNENNHMQSEEELVITQEGEYEFCNHTFVVQNNSDIKDKFPNDNSNEAFIALGSLKFPLQLRFRQPGDYIQPFGMQQTIKLKKYFINKKIPNHLKRCIILLCKNDEVLWVCGVGLSEKLRVKTKPEYILRLTEKG